MVLGRLIKRENLLYENLLTHKTFQSGWRFLINANIRAKNRSFSNQSNMQISKNVGNSVQLKHPSNLMKQCTESVEAHTFVCSMHKSPIDLVSNLLWNVGINAFGLNECPDTLCVRFLFPIPAPGMNICEWFWIFGHKILDYGLRWLDMKKSKSILTFRHSMKKIE